MSGKLPVGYRVPARFAEQDSVGDELRPMHRAGGPLLSRSSSSSPGIDPQEGM